MEKIINFYTRHKFAVALVAANYIFLLFGFTKILIRNDRYCGTDLVALTILSIIINSIFILTFVIQGLLRNQVKDFLLLSVIIVLPSIILLWFSGLLQLI